MKRSMGLIQFEEMASVKMELALERIQQAREDGLGVYQASMRDCSDFQRSSPYYRMLYAQESGLYPESQ